MDLYFKTAFLILLSFITFAFAGTVPWAFTTFLTGILVLLAVLIIRRGFMITRPFKIAAAGFLLLIIYTFIQGLSYTNILLPVPPYPASVMPLFTFEHISIFLSWFAVFTIAVNIPHKFKDTKLLLIFIIVITLLTAVLHGALRGDYLALFTKIKGGVGPFINRNNGGLFLFLGSMATLTMLLTGFAEKYKYTDQNKLQQFRYKQIALIVLTLIMFTATVFSRSRGAMLAIFNGLLFYSVLFSLFIPHTIQRKLIFTLITIISFTAIGFTAYAYRQEISSFAQRSTTISMDIRQDMYKGALKALKQRPYFGYGLGTVPVMITNYTDMKLTQHIQQLHNDPLELLLGIGFVAFTPLALLVIWFFISILRHIQKHSRRKRIFVFGIVSAMLAFMISDFFDFHFDIPACAAAFFAMAGLLCNETFYPQHHTRQPLGYISLSLMIIVFAASLYIPFQKTAAWRQINFGRGLKFEAQSTSYQNALNNYPSPRYALKLALAYYNHSLSKDITPQEKLQLRAQAHELAETYLKKYPRDKELSKVYQRTL